MESGVSSEDVTRCLEVLSCAIWCPAAKCLEGVGGKGENGEWDVKDPEVLKALLRSVVGGDVAGSVASGIGAKEVKERLVENTKLAFERGAFGLPWFECVNGQGEREGFWGFDHLGIVARFLGLDWEGEKARSGVGLRAVL